MKRDKRGRQTDGQIKKDTESQKNRQTQRETKKKERNGEQERARARGRSLHNGRSPSLHSPRPYLLVQQANAGRYEE